MTLRVPILYLNDDMKNQWYVLCDYVIPALKVLFLLTCVYTCDSAVVPEVWNWRDVAPSPVHFSRLWWAHLSDITFLHDVVQSSPPPISRTFPQQETTTSWLSITIQPLHRGPVKQEAACRSYRSAYFWYFTNMRPCSVRLGSNDFFLLTFLFTVLPHCISNLLFVATSFYRGTDVPQLIECLFSVCMYVLCTYVCMYVCII